MPDYLKKLEIERNEFSIIANYQGFRYFYIIQKFEDQTWKLFDRGIIRTWNPEEEIEKLFGEYRDDDQFRFCLYSSFLDDFPDNLAEKERKATAELIERIMTGIEYATLHGFQFKEDGNEAVSETTGFKLKSDTNENTGEKYYYHDSLSVGFGSLIIYNDPSKEEAQILNFLNRIVYGYKASLQRLPNILPTSVFHSGKEETELFLVEFDQYGVSILQFKWEEIDKKSVNFIEDMLDNITRHNQTRIEFLTSATELADLDEIYDVCPLPNILNYYFLYTEGKGKRSYGIPLSFFNTQPITQAKRFFNRELKEKYPDYEGYYDSEILKPVQIDQYEMDLQDINELRQRGLMPCNYSATNLLHRNFFYGLNEDAGHNEQKLKHLCKINFPVK